MVVEEQPQNQLVMAAVAVLKQVAILVHSQILITHHTLVLAAVAVQQIPEKTAVLAVAEMVVLLLVLEHPVRRAPITQSRATVVLLAAAEADTQLGKTAMLRQPLITEVVVVVDMEKWQKAEM